MAHITSEKVARFAKLARKYLIRKTHVLYDLESFEPITALPRDGEDQKLLGIGFDDRGLELEEFLGSS